MTVLGMSLSEIDSSSARFLDELLAIDEIVKEPPKETAGDGSVDGRRERGGPARSFGEA